jgi:tRNA dimethylallyltransferase
MEDAFLNGSNVMKWSPGLIVDNYVAIVGPTASGKSQLALQLAEHLPVEIINCDSVQVYKDFDIGSAKASNEERQRVPHHLLDVVHWSEAYDANRFRHEARQCIEEIKARGKIPLVVGGTGLYLRALWGQAFHDLPSDLELRSQLQLLSNEELHVRLQAVDPGRAKELHLHDRVRLLRACEIATLTGKTWAELTEQQVSSMCAPSAVILCSPERQVLHERLQQRTEAMLAGGLIEETQALLAAGCPRTAKPMLTIGYQQVCAYLFEEISRQELPDLITAASRQYAKRQLTWFRKVETTLTLTSYPFDVKAVLSALSKS